MLHLKSQFEVDAEIDLNLVHPVLGIYLYTDIISIARNVNLANIHHLEGGVMQNAFFLVFIT